MQNPTVKTVSLTLGAYILVSFAVQATSHFVLNVQHYADIPIMRTEPIMQLGILTMVVQATLAGLLFPTVRWADGSIRSGVKFAWLLGAFLGAYIVLTEPAKYLVPSITDWMLVESAATFVQFSLFGVLIALIHRTPDRAGLRGTPAG